MFPFSLIRYLCSSYYHEVNAIVADLGCAARWRSRRRHYLLFYSLMLCIGVYLIVHGCVLLSEHGHHSNRDAICGKKLQSLFLNLLHVNDEIFYFAAIPAPLGIVAFHAALFYTADRALWSHIEDLVVHNTDRVGALFQASFTRTHLARHPLLVYKETRQRASALRQVDIRTQLMKHHSARFSMKTCLNLYLGTVAINAFYYIVLIRKFSSCIAIDFFCNVLPIEKSF